MEITRALGDAGAPFPLPIVLPDGTEKVYYLTTLTMKRLSRIEQALIEDAKKDAARDHQRLRLGDDVYAALLHKINRDASSGYYRVGGQGYRNKVATWDGQAMLLKLLLETHQPQITDDEVESLLESFAPAVRSAMELVNNELMERMGVDESGNPRKPAPKGPTPAATA